MEALYISTIADNDILNYIKENSGINPGYAGAKFNRLIIQGLNLNGISTKSLTAIPANSECSKKFWFCKNTSEGGIKYHYIPFINYPLIKQILVFIYTFFYLLFWGILSRKKRFILIDVLNPVLCLSALASSFVTRVKIIGVVTDMPGLMVDSSEKHDGLNSKLKLLSSKINNWYIDKFDCYVLLTAQMNDIVNKNNKPFIVMEGLVDSTINNDVVSDRSFTTVKSILYAGGLHERYGLKTLVEAFTQLTDQKLRLVIFGSGPFESQLLEYSKSDNRIDYRGVQPNSVVIKEERNASILVNPRPTNEEFTKYSFPSKNMEYMSTGRPLLTTKLPGMPKEYYDFVYLFDSETVDGFKSTLSNILSLPEDELNKKGKASFEWVMSNKNSKVQTSFIINLVKSII